MLSSEERPCGFTARNQRFVEGAASDCGVRKAPPEYHASVLKVEATGDPERLRSAYQIVRRHIPGEGIFTVTPVKTSLLRFLYYSKHKKGVIPKGSVCNARFYTVHVHLFPFTSDYYLLDAHSHGMFGWSRQIERLLVR